MSTINLHTLEYDRHDVSCHVCELRDGVVSLFNLLAVAEAFDPELSRLDLDEVLCLQADPVPESLVAPITTLARNLIASTPLATTLHDVLHYAALAHPE